MLPRGLSYIALSALSALARTREIEALR